MQDLISTPNSSLNDIQKAICFLLEALQDNMRAKYFETIQLFNLVIIETFYKYSLMLPWSVKNLFDLAYM